MKFLLMQLMVFKYESLPGINLKTVQAKLVAVFG